MEFSHRLSISYYKTIATINEEHHVYCVQHQENKKIYIKKIMDVYNSDIYKYIHSNSITGIPKIYEVYEENSQLTVIEEYISGTSLLEMIESSMLNIESIINYMCELCDILGKLHSLTSPIIHRDIKPSNIIITPYDHVILIDFNAAKYLTNSEAQDTVLLGTKGYAAPEQYGFGSSTPQTDIYALGILLKELISTLPISSEKFDPIINKCTQINPTDRFKNVSVLKQSLIQLKVPFTTTMDSFKTFWKSIIPPGYRTLKPWKIGISSTIYLFIFWLCFTLQVENTTNQALWIERLFCLAIMLSVIFICFNYCDIQRFFPLCKSKNRLLHYLGILLFGVITVFSLFLIMVIILSIL